MKMQILAKSTALCFTTLVAATMVAVTNAQAAAPALEGQIILRPVTSVDKVRYDGLPADIEYSGGLNTVGKGVAVRWVVVTWSSSTRFMRP